MKNTNESVNVKHRDVSSSDNTVRGGQQQPQQQQGRMDDFMVDPFAEFRRISQQMDSLFNRMTRGLGLRDLGFGSGLPMVEGGSRVSDQEQRQVQQVPQNDRQMQLQGMMRNWAPVCNFVEKDNEYVVEAELPGVSKDEVNVEVVGNTLSISGETKNERREDKDRYHLYERSYGSFKRSMPLPQNALKDQIRGEFKDGLLTLHIGKSAQGVEQNRRIPIQ
jgi:HSP20 family protein